SSSAATLEPAWSYTLILQYLPQNLSAPQCESVLIHYDRWASPEAALRLKELSMSHSQLSENNSQINFNRYPDREVLWIGVPYPGSKLVDGVWYRRTVRGKYVRFPLQDRVHEIDYSSKLGRVTAQNTFG